MTDLIVGAVLVLILGAAVRYIIKAKKSGAKCIGCPAGGNGTCSCGCSGGTSNEKDEDK
ncbi:MAG: FeoB-associated Cys-rich membrane protein [Clostridia bacterium]|nr:FeoB-associated Cys-rich membrane protein [Clostridia bacterium]